MLSEEEQIYGSIYHTKKTSGLYCYSFDQVIMTDRTSEIFKKAEYIKIGDVDLIKKIRPNDEISNHLSIVVEFIDG